MRNIRNLQEIVGAYGVVPTYLLTYPVLEDDDVVRILQHQISRGECDVGVQLHPWVNPPYTDQDGSEASFSGNLAAGLEEEKLVVLMQKFTERFGVQPRIYRAGRYGLGQDTADLLEKHGFLIDTSVAPRTSSVAEGGPDHTAYDYDLFWFGKRRPLLELPLCRSVVGWAGAQASPLYRALSTPALRPLGVPALLTRSRCAERITLSPEGNDTEAMLRLVSRLRDRGQTVFVLSFHSSSLAVGRNPYIQTKAALHGFYDRLSGVLDTMVSRLGFEFASLSQIPSYMQPPAA
jgi:hypothetical protein